MLGVVLSVLCKLLQKMYLIHSVFVTSFTKLGQSEGKESLIQKKFPGGIGAMQKIDDTVE